jgi:hypothetical protein
MTISREVTKLNQELVASRLKAFESNLQVIELKARLASGTSTTEKTVKQSLF